MKYIFLALILIVFHLFLLTRLQFTAWPEMLSYPYFLENGFKLYKDIALPYQPLLPIILDIVYNFFGYNLQTLQTVTWMLILTADILIFYISLKLIGKKLSSLLPLGSYVLLQPLMEGNMLWFDLATTPLILLAIFFLLFLKNPKNFFWFGLVLSTAFFIKQQIGIIYLIMVIYLFFGRKFREIFYLVIGSLPVAILILLYIIANGILRDWFLWTIEIPLFWYPKFPSYSNLPSVKETLLVILLYAPAVCASLFIKKDLKLNIILFSFLGAFISAFPRFEYFRFQPALALYAIILASIIPRLKSQYTTYLFIPILLSIPFLFKQTVSSFNLETRFYGQNELKLSQEIITITKPTDKIFILNESSTHYVLSNRLPPKPWIDNYVWYMEIEGMQDKLLAGFRKEPPKIIFRRKPLLGNWYDLGTYEPKKVVEYIEQNYHIISTIDGIEIWIKN